MKILAFSDLHNDVAAAQRMVDLSEQADVVIGAGDFCNCQRGIEKTISVLSAIQKPVFVVPGNGETDKLLKEAIADWSSATMLHGEAAELDGVRFFGIGGGIPVTPFGDWSFDFSEDQAQELLANVANTDLLISHSPPWGVLDQSSRGDHLGSRTVRETIEKHRIPLTVCGHIHASWDRAESFGNGHVINAGPIGFLWDSQSNQRIE